MFLIYTFYETALAVVKRVLHMFSHMIDSYSIPLKFIDHARWLVAIAIYHHRMLSMRYLRLLFCCNLYCAWPHQMEGGFKTILPVTWYHASIQISPCIICPRMRLRKRVKRRSTANGISQSPSSTLLLSPPPSMDEWMWVSTNVWTYVCTCSGEPTLGNMMCHVFYKGQNGTFSLQRALWWANVANIAN